ncbi:hypothetical protein ACET3Z_015846 [Daucus carota]
MSTRSAGLGMNSNLNSCGEQQNELECYPHILKRRYYCILTFSEPEEMVNIKLRGRGPGVNNMGNSQQPVLAHHKDPLVAPRRRGRRPGVEKLLAQRYGEESGNTIKNQTSAEDVDYLKKYTSKYLKPVSVHKFIDEEIENHPSVTENSASGGVSRIGRGHVSGKKFNVMYNSDKENSPASMDVCGKSEGAGSDSLLVDQAKQKKDIQGIDQQVQGGEYTGWESDDKENKRSC